MGRTIHFSFVVSAMLILNGFSVFFAYAETANAHALITNDISVEVNTGGVDGKNGATGVDGLDGSDGNDGLNGSVTTGEAHASVKVETIVDGKTVPSATIDIETSSPENTVIEKHQTIMIDTNNTAIQETVNVNASHEIEAFNFETEASHPDEVKPGFMEVVSATFITVLKTVVSAISNLFALV